MWIIVGLGNPGDEYRENRHNYGFLLVDWLCRRWKVSLKESLRNGVYTTLSRNGLNVVLAKPMTYMNESGRMVAELLNKFNAIPAELVVAYDDLDLGIGQVKLRKQGGPGSHNGLGSVVDRIGVSEFPRLKLGIGPRTEGISGADFVLSDFKDEEVEVVKQVLDHTVAGLETLVARGIDRGMDQINRFRGPKMVQPTPD